MQMEKRENEIVKIARQVAGHEDVLRERVQEQQRQQRDRKLFHGTD